MKGKAMTMKEMSENIGKQFLIQESGIKYLVTVEDMGTAYGSVRAYIVPAAGVGGKWVVFDRLRPHIPGNLFAA
jgi:hypothetical protein